MSNEQGHMLQPEGKCSCGAEHDRRGTGESGEAWFDRHLEESMTAEQRLLRAIFGNEHERTNPPGLIEGGESRG